MTAQTKEPTSDDLAEWADVIAETYDEEAQGWRCGEVAWINRLGRWTYETCQALEYGEVAEYATEAEAMTAVAEWKDRHSREDLTEIDLESGWDTNQMRARAALSVALEFAEMSGQTAEGECLGVSDTDDEASVEQVLSDLICNLFHLGRWHGIDPHVLVEHARYHFDDEVAEEHADDEDGDE